MNGSMKIRGKVLALIGAGLMLAASSFMHVTASAPPLKPASCVECDQCPTGWGTSRGGECGVPCCDPP